MKFFMYSKCGDGCGLLLKIKQEGNQVRVFIKEKDYSSVYDGILPKSKVVDPESSEIVIFDSSSFGKEADLLKRNGHKVFGSSEFADKIENSRDFGLKFMLECGIQVPNTWKFTTFGAAQAFINSSDAERFVFKPSGKDLPSRLTYCGHDKEDLLRYMSWIERSYGSEIHDFCLQEFVDGAEVSSEFWCGPQGFVTPGNQTVEVKKLMNGDLGPSTGCSGNMVWRCDESKVLERGIRRAEHKLVDNSYIGPIDLNCIVNEDGVFGLEWTPRFGLDAMPSLLQILEQDVGKLIADIVNAQTKEMKLSEELSAGIRLTIPPYPVEPKSLKDAQTVSPNIGFPLHIPEGVEDSFYFYEVMAVGGEYLHSNGTGVIAVVSCACDTPQNAFMDCYEILEDVEIPDKQYRTDLANVLSDRYQAVEDETLCLD